MVHLLLWTIITRMYLQELRGKQCVGGTAWAPYWSDPALEKTIMGTEIFDSDDAYYQVQDGLGSIPGTSIFMEAMRGGPPTGTS